MRENCIVITYEKEHAGSHNIANQHVHLSLIRNIGNQAAINCPLRSRTA